MRIRAILRKSALLLALFTLLAVGTGWWCHRHVAKSSAPYLYTSMEALPPLRVGLVLGTSDKVRGGGPNLFFRHRITAAAALYHAGKVQRLLLSGDNGTLHYNEPWVMRRALIAAGVDSSHIALDHAGFRTLDSMVRAREVFGLSEFVVISQRFHVERAVYLARAEGIQVVGFCAADVDRQRGFRTLLREYGARVKVFVDHWLGTRPRFLGDPVPIP